jgi:hypothetical protein
MTPSFKTSIAASLPRDYLKCTDLNKSLYSHEEIHKILGGVEILDIVHKTHPPTVIFRCNLHK